MANPPIKNHLKSLIEQGASAMTPETAAGLQAIGKATVNKGGEKKNKKVYDEAAVAAEVPRMELPAFYVDTYHASYWGKLVRITLGEKSIKSGKYWRGAFLMEAKDARDLAEFLVDLTGRMGVSDEESED